MSLLPFSTNGSFGAPADIAVLGSLLPTDETQAAAWYENVSGVARRERLNDRIYTALSTPVDYLKEKGDAQIHRQKAIAVTFARKFKQLRDAGVDEVTARQLANNYAQAELAYELKLLDFEYPDYLDNRIADYSIMSNMAFPNVVTKGVQMLTGGNGNGHKK